MKHLLWISVLVLAVMACGLVTPPTPAPPTEVPVTLTPDNGPVPTEDAPQMGKVTGRLNYPADALPRMRIAFFNAGDGSLFAYLETELGQNTYEFELPAGTYTVVAYSIEGDGFPGGLAGGYTQYVVCGFHESCTDHGLVPFTVLAGQTLTDINPGDWYGPVAFPPMPQP